MTVRKVAGGGYKALIRHIRAGGRYDRSTVPIRPQDAEWAVLRPLLPPPSLTESPAEVAAPRDGEAIFYLVRSGCAWR